jgi:glutamyl/glutaminyl-tRNA synthetase
MARRSGAKVILRIEDHDRERCKPEYEAAILDDLDWLGFAPDVFPDTRLFGRAAATAGRATVVTSTRPAAQALAARGLL